MSRHNCPQCSRALVTIATGQFFGFGRCRGCGVVLMRDGGRWRILSSEEWAVADDELASLRSLDFAEVSP